MDLQMNEKLIKEKNYGDNFSYILLDNSLFSLTEYKVLKNQSDKKFLKCMKLLYNGKIQLYYVPGEYKSLKNLIRNMDIENVRIFITNLLKGVVEIKNNGFLDYRNIDFSIEKIYVDTKSFSVKLTYLPMTFQSRKLSINRERLFREQIVSVINEFSFILYNGVNIIARAILDGETSIEEIYNKILDGEIEINKIGYETFGQNSFMKIISVNMDVRVEVEITKDVFIIGRNTFATNGNNAFYNKMIGRTHCKIEKEKGKYYVEDLCSVNGTFLNGSKLEANKRQLIKDGDRLRLANVDFKIEII